jgi:predicted metal-dependent hydrolase
MKLTLQLKSFLEEQTRIYSKEINIEPPFVIFTDEELKEIEPTARLRKKEQTEKLGLSWSKGNVLPDRDVIWLNVDNSDYLWQVMDTIVHELLHLKSPQLEHGNEFQEIVNSIIMGKRN